MLLKNQICFFFSLGISLKIWLSSNFFHNWPIYNSKISLSIFPHWTRFYFLWHVCNLSGNLYIENNKLSIWKLKTHSSFSSASLPSSVLFFYLTSVFVSVSFSSSVCSWLIYTHPTHPDLYVLFPSVQSLVCIPFPLSPIIKIQLHTVLISCPVYAFTLCHEVIIYSSWGILPVLLLSNQDDQKSVRRCWTQSFPSSMFLSFNYLSPYCSFWAIFSRFPFQLFPFLSLFITKSSVILLWRISDYFCLS